MKFLVLFAGFILAANGLYGCTPEDPPIRQFKTGDIVQFVVSGQRGQIINANYCTGSSQKKGQPCTYDVRVFSPQVLTNTRLFGSDDPISQTTIARIDYVREYELRKVDQ